MFFSLLLASLIHQAVEPIPIAEARRVFAEAKVISAADAGRLWGVSLDGPMMLVDGATHRIVANRPDKEGRLKPKDGVFVGTISKDQNLANTDVRWSGTHWTQILWPLPKDDAIRHTMEAHELFHRIQDQLGLPKTKNTENAHLDSLKGRYYLQLEWRALSRALGTKSPVPVQDALNFRKERYRLFPKAADEERALEGNEGLAEYTGVYVGNATDKERVAAARYDLAAHETNPTFVRSFAYATGPAYGLLLDRYRPDWRKALKHGRSMDELLAAAVPPPVRQSSLEFSCVRYGGKRLLASETVRDEKRQALLADLRKRFIDGPCLYISFKKMSVQFNPSNLQPLDDKGTVYPTIRVVDKWGILAVSKGALMKPDWSGITVTAPSVLSAKILSGDGWTLALASGWHAKPAGKPGSYKLQPD